MVRGRQKQQSSAAGIGCLALIVLAPIGMIMNACSDDEDTVRRSGSVPVTANVVPSTTARATTTRPVPTTTVAPVTTTTTTRPAPRPAPRPDPDPDPEPNRRAPVPAPREEPKESVYYANCDAAKAAGAAPMQRGEPGYRSGLDRDKDGTACDK